MRFLNVFKNTGKVYVLKFLELLVKIKLSRTRPTIIGITGSFGKTSTKEAIYEVLKTRWNVYRNQKSLNTEIGLLLAVLEQPSGFSSPVKWIKILAAAVKNALYGKKYDLVVLEYGADKPGDISHLVKIAKPHIAVITHISSVHQTAGQFKNEEEVFNEKKCLVKILGPQNTAILNWDDRYLKKLNNNLRAKILWFNSPHGIFAEDLTNTHTGFRATIHMASQKYQADFAIPGAYHVDIFLPAILCGILNGISPKESIAALEKFKLPPGRMSIVEGKNGAILLDSSYNASPETTKQALNLLKEFPAKKRIAVLGNMNELGAYSREAHKEIAKYIDEIWLDELVTVGDLAHLIASEALKKGFPKNRIKILSASEEAGEYLREKSPGKDYVILFKGSQNRVRLERAIKMVMAHPERARDLLCRQEPEWEKIN